VWLNIETYFACMKCKCYSLYYFLKWPFKEPNILFTGYFTPNGSFWAPVLLLPVSIPVFPILGLLFYSECQGSSLLWNVGKMFSPLPSCYTEWPLKLYYFFQRGVWEQFWCHAQRAMSAQHVQHFEKLDIWSKETW
jgi:hypothetical protein